MDPASAAHFTALRRAHFPAHRNWLDAHITLFHALPGATLDQVRADVGDQARRTVAFAVQIDRVLFLGGGVAFAIRSAEGVALRQALALRWDAFLGRQDRAWRGPLHITVQNKVAATTARALHDQLMDSVLPAPVDAIGIDVWRYEGGPWQHIEGALFSRA